MKKIDLRGLFVGCLLLAMGIDSFVSHRKIAQLKAKLPKDGEVSIVLKQFQGPGGYMKLSRIENHTAAPVSVAAKETTK